MNNATMHVKARALLDEMEAHHAEAVDFGRAATFKRSSTHSSKLSPAGTARRKAASVHAGSVYTAGAMLSGPASPLHGGGSSAGRLTPDASGALGHGHSARASLDGASSGPRLSFGGPAGVAAPAAGQGGGRVVRRWATMAGANTVSRLQGQGEELDDVDEDDPRIRIVYRHLEVRRGWSRCSSPWGGSARRKSAQAVANRGKSKPGRCRAGAAGGGLCAADQGEAYPSCGFFRNGADGVACQKWRKPPWQGQTLRCSCACKAGDTGGLHGLRAQAQPECPPPPAAHRHLLCSSLTLSLAPHRPHPTPLAGPPDGQGEDVLDRPAHELRPLLGSGSRHVVGAHLLYNITKKSEMRAMWGKVGVPPAQAGYMC